VGPPDYAAALDNTAIAAPYELYGLIKSAAEPLGAFDVSIYLADFQAVVLQPVLLSLDLGEPILAEEDVASSMAGRTFRTGETMTADRDGVVRVWVPLLERGERTGVVALTLPEVDEGILSDCKRLGVFAGLLVRSFARATDLMHLRRRRRPMTLAAGMQWDLLPPLTVRSSPRVRPAGARL
jgi:hypothetical protein